MNPEARCRAGRPCLEGSKSRNRLSETPLGRPFFLGCLRVTRSDGRRAAGGTLSNEQLTPTDQRRGGISTGSPVPPELRATRRRLNDGVDSPTHPRRYHESDAPASLRRRLRAHWRL